jgi:hypothetical protein
MYINFFAKTGILSGPENKSSPSLGGFVFFMRHLFQIEYLSLCPIIKIVGNGKSYQRVHPDESEPAGSVPQQITAGFHKGRFDSLH